MTNTRTFRITTLGCRVNHAETRELESILRRRGLSPAPPDHPADLEVVHTCSVTNQAAAKSRQAVRRARRRLPTDAPDAAAGHTHRRQPEILVTGCYASTDTQQAAETAGRDDRVLTHAADDHSTLLDRFARRIDQWLERKQKHQHHSIVRSVGDTCSDSPASPAVLPLPVIEPAPAPSNGRPGETVHTRAELKIQDGCDACCTFCILPKIRPTLRSKTIDDAVAEARRLVDRGHLEIVLTGIFIGAYGHETALRRRQQHRHASPLADLLDAVARRVPGLERLRISSMEPGDVDQPLLDAMLANAPTVVPHLHLPLQSGSDDILTKMNRQYRVGDYLDMIDHVNDALTTPDGLPPAITTDIICGFPGEKDADFRKTVDIARRVGYLHMHVFPFSPKRGTAAARWTDRFVPPDLARRRVRQLIDLETDPHDGLSIRYRRRLLGRRTRVILEQPARDADGQIIPGTMTGRCDHYARIDVPTDQPRGTLLDVDITHADPARTCGRPVPASVALPIL